MRPSNNIRLSPPDIDSILYLADHIRDIDVCELADTGNDAHELIKKAFIDEEVVFVAWADKKPLAAFCAQKQPSLGSVLTQKRYCWFVATPEIEKLPVGVLLVSVYTMEKIMTQIGPLYTYVRNDNPKALRYIRALGFTTNGAQAIFSGHPATYYERLK